MHKKWLIFSILTFLSFMASAAVAADNAAVSFNANPGSNSTQQIETTVHQYLLKKPEVVVEALQVYQQKQMELMQKMFKETEKIALKYADILFHQAMDPIGGNVDGKVTIVEFSDYQCSHCIEVAPIINKAIQVNPALRIVIKEFPIRGPVSDAAARAALAADKQGKYWEFRQALFSAGGILTEDKIYDLAKSVGLDVDKLKKDMDDVSIRDKVKANQKLAQDLKLIGTPALFVAKSDVKTSVSAGAINYVPGMLTQEQLQAMLNKLKR